jgi:hypothetical protein
MCDSYFSAKKREAKEQWTIKNGTFCAGMDEIPFLKLYDGGRAV